MPKVLKIETESDRQHIISLLREWKSSDVWKEVIIPVLSENLEVHSQALKDSSFTDIKDVYREQAFAQIIEKFLNMPANMIRQLENYDLEDEEEELDLDPFKK